jgi:hypothetical protein
VSAGQSVAAMAADAHPHGISEVIVRAPGQIAQFRIHYYSGS